MTCLQLANELNCESSVALSIIQAIANSTATIASKETQDRATGPVSSIKHNSSSSATSFSALDAVQMASSNRPIISFCKNLDKANIIAFI